MIDSWHQNKEPIKKTPKNQSNHIAPWGSKTPIPLLGTETNIFSPISSSAPQRVSTSSSSNLRQLLLLSSPLQTICLSMPTTSANLLLSTTIRTNCPYTRAQDETLVLYLSDSTSSIVSSLMTPLLISISILWLRNFSNVTLLLEKEHRIYNSFISISMILKSTGTYLGEIF